MMKYLWKEKGLVIENRVARPVGDEPVDGLPLYEDTEDYKNAAAARLRGDINAARDDAVSAPYPYMGTEFDTDPRSMANMAEQVLELLLDPNTSVVWIDAYGQPVVMTADQFKAMVMGIGARKKAAYLDAAQRKTEIGNG